MPTEELTFVYVGTTDARARVILDDLERDYDDRYGDVLDGPASVEIYRYPVEAFRAPHGAFVVVQKDGVTVAGGAFMRLDEQTAEFKRIWTHPDHRRRGLSRRVLTELEAEAVRRGYRRVFLTTGPRQPEAVGLYRSAGYSDAAWPGGPDAVFVGFAFEKTLTA
jgi:ribosomal protein S18 acetylase RimI-like enzyme